MAVALESPQGQGAGTGCVGAGSRRRRRGAAAAAPAASGGGASRCACRAVAGWLSTGPGTPGTACPALAATGLGLGKTRQRGKKTVTKNRTLRSPLRKDVSGYFACRDS